MVNLENTQLKCGSCPEHVGCPFNGYVYCAMLGQDVWADSLRCPHGIDIEENAPW